MAIALEFIDLVIPVALIGEKYPGGWVACLSDHERWIGRRVWFDEHLFRDGATTAEDMQLRLEGWAVLGFNPRREVRGVSQWDDLCVVDIARGGPAPLCDWLRVNPATRTAWHAHMPRGTRVDRHTVARGASPRVLSTQP